VLQGSKLRLFHWYGKDGPDNKLQTCMMQNTTYHNSRLVDFTALNQISGTRDKHENKFSREKINAIRWKLSSFKAILTHHISKKATGTFFLFPIASKDHSELYFNRCFPPHNLFICFNCLLKSVKWTHVTCSGLCWIPGYSLQKLPPLYSSNIFFSNCSHILANAFELKFV
jgi:hypothetical protein